MQSHLISEVQFSKLPGEHTPRPPWQAEKLFSPPCGDQPLSGLIKPGQIWARSAPAKYFTHSNL